ncbi:insecticidal delta-endotoxin Cry8Ea1 family protein [Vallitalea guaymasensis]|uniref:insecticidal delta-endotoxin Cry8Ea1 family protein n=1 Tax=Vallitalea guaymasensis TaxID=1185412 RepID=UPI000DE1AB1E|nr:insecticidal delta-endotoxin Cry8Ea1 family protein [Vallitalea guaymasensis]
MKKSGRKLIISFILITVMIIQIFTLSVMATQTNNIFEDINSYTRAKIFNMTTQELIQLLETDNYLDVQNALLDDPGFDLIPGVDLPIEDGVTATKAVVTGAIGCIPHVGALVSSVAGLFIPDSIPELEADIKNEMYAVINYEFSQDTLRVLSTNIIGILNNADRYRESLVLYSKYLENPTNDSLETLKSELRSSADEYLSNIEQYISNFQKDGYEVVSLPLFTLMANLHLTLLRDLALNGVEWGYSNAKVDLYTQDIKNKVKNYREYVQRIYQEGLNSRKQDAVMTDLPSYAGVYDLAPARNVETYRWNYINDYKRYMRMNVLDLASLWTYYDVVNYPDNVNFEQVEHIYSPIVGLGNWVGGDNFNTYDKIDIYEKMQPQPVTIGYKAYDSSNLVTVIDISPIDASIYNNYSDYTMGMNLKSTGVLRDIDTVSAHTGSIPGENDAVSYVVPMAYGINGYDIGVKSDNGKTWDFNYDGYKVWRRENFDVSSGKEGGLNHSILGVVFEFRPKFSNYDNVVFGDRISVIPAEKSYYTTSNEQIDELLLGGDSIKPYITGYKIYSPVEGDFQIRYRASSTSNNTEITTYLLNYDTGVYANVAETTLNMSTDGFVTDNGTYDLYDVTTVRLKKGINEIKIETTNGPQPLLSSIEFKPIKLYEDETLDYDYIQPKDPAIIEEPINVDFFDNTYYQGTALFKDLCDNKIMNLYSIYGYDFKSIKFDGDYTITGFENTYFSGASHTFTNSNPNLNINYDIQSLRIVKGGNEGVYLYSEKNYGGIETKVSFDCINTDSIGIANDTVSSIKIVGDYVVKAYKHENYSGDYSYLTTSDPDLTDNVIGDNQISSIKINKVDPVKLQEGVFVYKDTNYSGEWVRLVSGDYYSSNGIGLGNDAISSIKIIGDYQVEAFEDIDFGGKSQVIKASDYSLYDDFIGDNSISSLKIRTIAP